MTWLPTASLFLPLAADAGLSFGSPGVVLLLALVMALTGFLTWHHVTFGNKRGAFTTWPFLGQLPGLLGRLDDLHDAMAEGAEKSPNMAIFMCIPGLRELSTANPAHIQYILKDNFANYPKGPASCDSSRDFFGHGIFASDGEQWLFQRKIASYEFSTNSLRSLMLVTFHREVKDRLMPVLKAAHRSGALLDLQDVFLRYTLDSICAVGFGADPHALSPEFPEVPVMRSLDRASEAVMMRSIQPPALWKAKRALAVGEEAQLARDLRVLHAFVNGIIERRKAESPAASCQGTPCAVGSRGSLSCGSEVKPVEDHIEERSGEALTASGRGSACAIGNCGSLSGGSDVKAVDNIVEERNGEALASSGQGSKCIGGIHGATGDGSTMSNNMEGVNCDGSTMSNNREGVNCSDLTQTCGNCNSTRDGRSRSGTREGVPLDLTQERGNPGTTSDGCAVSKDMQGVRRTDFLSKVMTLGERDNGQNFSDTFLRDACINFIVAGRDTSAAALTWLFWTLCLHPRVQDKILDEVRRVLDARGKAGPSLEEEPFSFEELKLLNFTHAAINESLRLYPPVPVDCKTAASDDTFPDGTRVCKGWRVLYNIYAVGRMTRVWGVDALEYKPERWLADDGQVKVESPFKFPVFNAGPRLCLGRDMAYLQMKLVVSNVLLKYRLQPAPSHEAKYNLGITLSMKNGLPVTVMPRDD